MQTPALTIGVLLGRGVRLALGAQREREAVKLQPARPTNANPGRAATPSPGFLFLFLFFYTYFFFYRLLYRVHTQGLPEAPAGHPRFPTQRCFAQGCPCRPGHPDSESPEEASAGREGSRAISAPFGKQAAATRLLWMLFAKAHPSK